RATSYRIKSWLPAYLNWLSNLNSTLGVLVERRTWPETVRSSSNRADDIDSTETAPRPSATAATTGKRLIRIPASLGIKPSSAFKLYSYLRAIIGSTFVALRAGI